MYELRVPGVPPPLNRYYAGVSHWRRTADKNKWRSIFGAAIREQLPKRLVVPLTLSVTENVKRSRDPDGAVVAAKFLMDALVDTGRIDDDGPNQISCVILRVVKTGKDETVILIS